MQISSLLLQAAANLIKYPLEHYQGKLIPVGECIPGCDDLPVPPKVLYRFEHVQVPLNWQTVSYSFQVKLTFNQYEDSKMIENELSSRIERLQKEIDTAIKKESDLLTMLPWLDKKYRKGFGDYGTLSGGYGSIIDRRTKNQYGVFAHTEVGRVTFELTFTFTLINI